MCRATFCTGLARRFWFQMAGWWLPKGVWERLEMLAIPQTRAWRKYFEELPLPDELPAFDALLGDAEGKLWLRNGLGPGAVSAVWTVAGQDGRVLADIVLPAACRITDVQQDRLVCIWPDSLGVERVVVLPLDRGGTDEAGR